MSKPLPELYFDLAKMRDTLSDPTKWLKFDYRRNDQVCLDQAVLDVAFEKTNLPMMLGRSWEEPYCRVAWPLLAAAQEVGGLEYRSLVHFNDHRDTTHGLVLKAIDRAMVLAVRDAP